MTRCQQVEGSVTSALTISAVFAGFRNSIPILCQPSLGPLKFVLKIGEAKGRSDIPHTTDDVRKCTTTEVVKRCTDF